MSLGPQTVFFSAAISFAVALLATPVARRLALRWGIMDNPAHRKIHVEPVPYLGGAGLIVALAAFAIPSQVLGGAVALIGLSLAFGAIGFLDDLRGGLSARIRLGIQVLGSILVYSVGVQANVFGHVLLDLPLTILWIVGITNAFNLLDNMDGLCAGIATIVSAFFTILAFMNGQWLVGALAATVFGFTLGFLIFNFSPARIFLGDMGSLTLGFLLAVIGLQLRFPEVPHIISFAIPVVVLGIAIFDTTLVTLLRIRDKMPVTQGGKDHVSHRLVNMGMSHFTAVALLWIVSGALGALALVISTADLMQGATIVFALGFMALVAGAIFSFISVERRPADADTLAAAEKTEITPDQPIEEGTINEYDLDPDKVGR